MTNTEAELECPVCSARIRSRLGDQAVIRELVAQGWGPAHRPRWHDWLDTALVAGIFVVDLLWVVLR
jgi:hypothetical protein